MITKSISHEEYLKRKRNKKLWKFGTTLFLVILILGIASYLSHRPEIRISKVELNGGVLVTQPDIESQVFEYMEGSYLWLFPKNNIFWYPRNSLEQYLRDSFKRIDTIDIYRDGFQNLVIDIKERKPFAIWCEGYSQLEARPNGNEGSTEVTSPKCYFLDQNSTIFAQAPNFSGDAYFKYYGLLSVPEEESPIGMEYLASTTLFNEISNFVAKTKELSLRPIYLLAQDNGDFSLNLVGGGEIYFDMKEPLSRVGQNLEILLRTKAFTNSTGDLPIEYIDLRYGNKLFYKLKQ